MRFYKIAAVLLTLTSGIILLQHQLVFQPVIAQGDHGRDLYAFTAAMDGQMPYKDYWWVYGPLTPFYYQTFFKLFGISIKSVLLGQTILLVAAGIFFFLTLTLFIPPLFAYAGTLWFWVYNMEFFFTYNHYAGIALLMIAVYCLSRYFRFQNTGSLFWGLGSVFLLAMVKVNFGLAAIAVFNTSVLLNDGILKIKAAREKKLFYVLGFFLIPALIFFTYFGLTAGMPLHEIRQCLPYFSADHPYHMGIGQALWLLWNATAVTINSSWADRIFSAFLILAMIKTFLDLARGKIPGKEAVPIALVICSSFLFYTLNLHEYLVSGVLYRAFWAKPFSTMLIFLFLGLAFRQYSKPVQTLFFLTLFLLAMLRYHNQVEIVHKYINPGHFFAHARARIFSGNEPAWFQTVEQTSDFLNKNLAEDECFFALPYDAIYYYLTGKKSPTRQLIFFDHINIPEEQERTVIEDLKKNNVRYIVLSSRFSSPEPGMGVFGKTYCPVLKEYFDQNYQFVKQFGVWDRPAGWAWNHGVAIFEKKQ